MDGHTEGLVESVLGADKKPVTWDGPTVTTKRPEIGPPGIEAKAISHQTGKGKLSTQKYLLGWDVLVTFQEGKEAMKNGRKDMML